MYPFVIICQDLHFHQKLWQCIWKSTCLRRLIASRNHSEDEGEEFWTWCVWRIRCHLSSSPETAWSIQWRATMRIVQGNFGGQLVQQSGQGDWWNEWTGSKLLERDHNGHSVKHKIGMLRSDRIMDEWHDVESGSSSSRGRCSWDSLSLSWFD